jgi:hypothetical protein
LSLLLVVNIYWSWTDFIQLDVENKEYRKGTYKYLRA